MNPREKRIGRGFHISCQYPKFSDFQDMEQRSKPLGSNRRPPPRKLLILLLSSRAQAGAALGGKFPIRTLSVVWQITSSSMVHVSWASSKIPYLGFSPARLQTKAYKRFPAQQTPSVKCEIHIPPEASGFDRALVNHVPSCLGGKAFFLGGRDLIASSTSRKPFCENGQLFRISGISGGIEFRSY